ncbi:MAG: PTS sugar transporter subunit IIA, partial [Desulfobulbaceae bacterium]|nr:PTS sugar transporter subunit IIA [Desulfobulbaceae bacterium]
MFKQLDSTRILPRLAARSKKEVLAELAAAVAGQFPGADAATITAVLLEREVMGSTGVGDSIALPHGKIKGLPELILWFGRSMEGISFDSHDGKPAHLFFLMLAP